MEGIVSNNLKVLRENSGYTQKQLADFLGLNRSAYANYEAGERIAPLPVLEDVAKLFKPNFTTKSSGTGLGLAISRNIIEKCDGEIRYQK